MTGPVSSPFQPKLVVETEMHLEATITIGNQTSHVQTYIEKPHNNDIHSWLYLQSKYVLNQFVNFRKVLNGKN